MAGKPGRSGTNKNKDKPWVEALRLAVNRKDGDVKRINMVADAVVAAAMTGDMQAAKEIGDRLDGKPSQAIVGDPDKPIVHRIERVIVDSKD